MEGRVGGGSDLGTLRPADSVFELLGMLVQAEEASRSA